MRKKLTTILCTLTIAMNTYAYADSYIMETVEKGEDYWTISEKYGIDVDELQTINNDYDEILFEGDLIKIRPIETGKEISIILNGEKVTTDEEPYMENDRVFVPIRFIAESLGLLVEWDEKTESAILKSDDLEIKLPLKSQNAMVNGNELNLDAPINVYNGRTFVPLRFIAETLNCTVDWDGENYTVNIFTHDDSLVVLSATNTTLESKYEEDLFWLSRIVEAESQGEPFEGKLAVANVVINRVESDKYPNTIKEVIFDKQDGYIQFSPVINGTIYNDPSSDSIKAAEMALQGNNNIEDCEYFLNPDRSTNFWIVDSKTFYKSIGQHDFYR